MDVSYIFPPFNSSDLSAVLCINVSGCSELICVSDISKWHSLQLFPNVEGWTLVIQFPFKSSHCYAVLCINVSGCIELVSFRHLSKWLSLLLF